MTPENEQNEEISVENIEQYLSQEPVPTMQEQTITSLSMMVMNTLSAESPRHYVRLYQYIKILAKRLNEKGTVKELDDLDASTRVRDDISLPLAILNYTYDKDSYAGYSICKTYIVNLGTTKRASLPTPTYFHRLAIKQNPKKVQITLGEIIMALNTVKVTMIDIYTRLAIEHNIEISQISPPELSGEAMPSL